MLLTHNAARGDEARVEIYDGAGNDWDEFVGAQTLGAFYHLYAWRAINERELGHDGVYLVARAGGRIVGVLPLVLIRSRLLQRVLCSLPFVNYGGPCAVDERVATLLVQAAIERADAIGVDYLELRCASALATDLPVSLRKISMTLALDRQPDALWNAFTSKHRTNIRRAYKNRLEVRAGGGELLPVFYSVMEQSWRNLGTPLYARAYFAAILQTFPANTRIFVCYREGEPVAAAFNGDFNGVVEGMWAGGSARARQLDANLVLYWEMIKDACERGYASFHLGRSTAASGGEEFKRKWNAGARQLRWYLHRPDGGPLPEVNVDNPKFRLAIATWKRLPLWLTRIAGPRLARLIP